MLKSRYSIAILAGGKNRRFGGEIKALQYFRGKKILQRILETCMPLSDDVFIVANKTIAFQDYKVPVISDVFPDSGPLGGIHAALTVARYDWTLVLASDMPLISTGEIKYLNSQLADDCSALLPCRHNQCHPLHAMYHKTVLPETESVLKHGNSLSLRMITDRIAAKKVKVGNPASYININTPEDLKHYEKSVHYKD
jgi:molybdopterin-guanine dinucleotide biosynthesis protein A